MWRLDSRCKRIPCQLHMKNLMFSLTLPTESLLMLPPQYGQTDVVRPLAQIATRTLRWTWR